MQITVSNENLAKILTLNTDDKFVIKNKNTTVEIKVKLIEKRIIDNITEK
jgi:hypothetical protein